MEMLLASNNRDKADEFERIFWRHTILIPSDLGMVFEYEEKGESYLANATGKAFTCHEMASMPVIADDSGLCINALGGMPGVQSSRYGSSEGKLLSAREKNELVLSKLAGVEDRSAAFVCCLVLVLSDYRFFIIQETCEGEIALEQRGSGGFGYDPIFLVPERKMTIAELPDREKDEISHRGRACSRLLAVLETI
jgi:XTP/dITP diphosphohydrolase